MDDLTDQENDEGRRRQRAVEDLFDSVRSLPEDRRDAAIDAGSADPLVRREVRSLLRFDEATLPTIGEARVRDLDPEACIGLSAGGFTLRRLLGVGGMGTVFEADQELPARKIAVKILHGGHTRASTLARFRKESEFLARLDHQHIARVISAGSLQIPGDRGIRPYFAMELVPGGRSITRWARETKASRRAVVEMLAAACGAVGSGHRLGVVHLDLKPGNLLVSETGALRVIDYGIARSLEAARDETRSLAGTPQYMSPEQLAQGAQVDSRADVYALGLVLYELLTDRLPYETRGAPIAEVSRLVNEQAPTDPRRIDSTIPAELAAITMKAIAKPRDARYGTASELGDDLRRWLADEPVVALKPSLASTALRSMRRNPVATGLALLAALAMVAGVVFWIRLGIAEQKAKEVAERLASHANMRAASASLRLEEPADAFINLSRVKWPHRGWEADHMKACVERFTLLAPASNEILSVCHLPATNEAAAIVTGGFLIVADLSGARAPEEYDFSTAGPPPTQSGASIDALPGERRIYFVNNAASLVEIDRDARTIRTIPGSASMRVKCVDGAIVVATPRGGIGFVDRERRSIAEALPGSADANDASFSADGAVALVAFADGSLRCIDIGIGSRTARTRWTQPPRFGSTRAAAVSPDGSTMLVAWNDGRIARIDPADGATLKEQDLRSGNVFDLVISPDGRTAAASGWVNMVRLVDTESLEVTDRLGGTTAHVWNIAFDEAGRRLFGGILPDVEDSAGIGHCLGAWTLGDDSAVRDSMVGRAVAGACHGPDGDCFTACDADGNILELRTHDGSVRRLATLGKGAITIARSASRIAAGFTDGSVSILAEDSEGFVRSKDIRGAMQDQVTCLGFSPDGRRLAVGSRGLGVAMIDTESGELLWRSELPPGDSPESRRQVMRAIFLDGGTAVTFAAIVSTGVRPDYDTESGRVVSPAGRVPGLEHVDGLLHPSSAIPYFLGMTGFVAWEPEGLPRGSHTLSRTGGLFCTDRNGTRLFAAMRDGFVRVCSFDPVDDLMRLDSPTGRPVAVGFDDDRQELTVLTERGIARTWSGRRPFALPPQPTPILLAPIASDAAPQR
ncbi:MAG: Serine/threonine-protein kinase PrkC [Planctomycetota bacterium]